MADEQVKLDPNTFVPFQKSPEEEQAQKLQQSMAYGAGQNPDAYAKLITLHKQTGVPPQVAQGNEAEVEHAAKVNSIDYPAMAVSHPRTSSWVSNPDNAAVSHDDIGTLTNIESFGDRLKKNYAKGDLFSLPGVRSVKAIVQSVLEIPSVNNFSVNNGKTVGQAANDADWLYKSVRGPLQRPVLQINEHFGLSSGVDYLANNRPEVTKGVIPDAVWNLISGVSKAEARTAVGLSTPENMMILGGSGDLPLTAKTLLDTYFASEMIPGLLETPKRIMDAPNASEGIAAGVEGLINAYFTKGVVGGIGGHTPFVEDLAQIITSGELSKLKARSPEKFHEALTEIFDGHDSLQIPVEQFDTYFQSKNINPAEVAQQIGANNYLEAKATGGHVEVAPQDFIGKLDSEHQKGLLGDVVDPQTGMTHNQRQEGEQELQKFIADGGIEKLREAVTKADAETQASPEYQDVKTQLRQQYIDAGELPAVADNIATLQTNALANIARESGTKISELASLYRPVKVGEAPQASNEVMNQPAFHGSPYKFDKFTLEHIGKGEGAQAYGWGLYFAGNKEVAEHYRQSLKGYKIDGEVVSATQLEGSKELAASALSRFGNKKDAIAWIGEYFATTGDEAKDIIRKAKSFGPDEGQTYKADIPNDDTMLHWDKPLSEQPEPVKNALKNAGLYEEGGSDLGEFAGSRVVGAPVTGASLYDTIAIKLGKEHGFGSGDSAWSAKVRDDKAASEFLHAQGIDGIKYLDGSSRSKGEGSHNYVIFDESAIKILKTYYQGENTQPRGWFRVLPDGSFEIGKTKIGDLSTFVHEPAHSYLFLMNELVKREGASENLKGDYAKILDFLGAKDGEALTTEQHEKWARANEQYLREGKAPSEGLKGVFQRFSVWLSSIYKRASDLGVELSDDIRGVMDRLYASEDGVNRAAKESGDTGDVVDHAKAEILSKLNEAAIREKTEAWREEEQSVKEAVTAEIDQKPEYRALRILSDGKLEDGTPLALNRDELVKQFGEARVKELQLQNKRIYRLKGGVDAETAAEVLGFNSGEEMMRAMEAAPKRSAAIEQATREFMTAKHGDIRYDGTLDDQARIALENDKKAAKLHKELKTLQKQVAEMQGAAKDKQAATKAIAIPPIDAFRATAETIIATKPILDLQPTRYLDASRKASREAFDAMGKEDAETAAQAKTKELINHFLFREATKAKAEAEKTLTQVQKYTSAKVREKIAQAGGAEGQHVYLDQIDNILEQFRFKKESKQDIQRATLEQFAAQRQAQAAQEFAAMNPNWAVDHPGEAPEIPQMVDTSIAGISKNYRELTITELRAVRDALKNIETLARREYSIIRDGKAVSFDQEVADFERIARENNTSKTIPRSGTKLGVKESVVDSVHGLDAAMQKIEWFVDRLDAGDVNGPARRNIKKPIDDAWGESLRMGDEVFGKLKDLIAARPKEDVADLNESTGIQFPKFDRPLNRRQLVSWALNLGTAENQKVALIGEGLLNPDGSPSPLVDQALRSLRKSELDYIQGVWDILESMRPAIEAKALRTTGIAPKMKKVTPFDVVSAEGVPVHMRGGYYPLKSEPGDRVGQKQNDPANMFTAGSMKPKTSTSHLQEVTGATYRLMLDYEQVLSKHLADVISDTTKSEAISQVYKFINEDRVRSTIQETLGAAESKEFMEWLRDFAGNNRSGGGDNLPLVQWLMNRRSGMVVARLGGNLSSYLIQFGDIFKSIADPDIQTKYVAKAFLDIRRNPTELIEQIRALSPNEMAHREKNFNRDIRDMLESKSPFDEKKQVVTEFLMEGFAVMDRLVTFPAWLGRFRQGMAEHGDQRRAVAEADRAIARDYMAGDNRNMSRMMRSGGLVRLLTTFQGDANTWYGLISSSIRSGSPKAISVGIMALVAEQIVGQYIRNRGPKKDENYAGWGIEQVLLAGLNLFPVVGDVGQYAMSKLTGQYASLQNPTMQALEKTGAAPGAIYRRSQGKIDTQEMLMELTEAAGIYIGIPGTSQAIKTWKYIHNVQTGKEPAPKGTVEAVRGAAQGSNRKR